ARGRSAMRIVARSTCHSVARCLLAFTSQQRLPLACSAPARAVLAAMHKERCVIEEIVARAKILRSSVAQRHSHLSFQMTGQAYRVAPHRLKRIDIDQLHL